MSVAPAELCVKKTQIYLQCQEGLNKQHSGEVVDTFVHVGNLKKIMV